LGTGETREARRREEGSGYEPATKLSLRATTGWEKWGARERERDEVGKRGEAVPQQLGVEESVCRQVRRRKRRYEHAEERGKLAFIGRERNFH
jgi:hypothetical protein